MDSTYNNDCYGGGAWVLIILFALIFGFNGNGFGGNNGYTAATTADIQRAVDLNSIQRGQADIAADVQRTNYEQIASTKDAAYNNLSEIRDIGTTVNNGNSNIINMLTAMMGKQSECCCETKQMIMENRYLAEKNTASIEAVSTANSQKILDAINTNRMADMQNQINQLQLANAVSGVVRYPMASTYSSGSNPFCGGCNANI